jgi:uncharacterized membrane protein YfcA
MKLFFSRILPILFLGLGAGFLNGLLGAGGGILIVFGLGLLLRDKLDDPRSVFASAIAVMLPLSAISAFRYFQNGYTEEARLGFLLIPAIAGGALGAWLLRRLTPRALSHIFAAVVLVSGIVLVV